MRHNGGRREGCVGGGSEGGGESGGGDGGGDEEPSKLRAEKVGWCGLSTLVTWRLPDSEVGDGRWWRGRGEEDHQVKHLWLPQPRRLGGQPPAGYGGLSL